MKPQILVLGAALIAAGLGAFFLLSDPGSGAQENGTTTLIVDTSGQADGAADPEGQHEPLADLGGGANAAGRQAAASLLEPAVTEASTTAAEVLRNVDTTTAQRVVVEIAWPQGTPAAGADLGAETLIAWSDEVIPAADFDWTSESFRRSRRRRSSGYAALETLKARVNDDEVRFDVVPLNERVSEVEVLFDAGAKVGRIQLASPFLYLASEAVIALEEGETSVRLEPEVGAWISGRVDAGATRIAADANGSYGRVSLRGGRMGGGRGRGGNFTDQSTELDAELRFNFYGVNPSLVLQATADVPGMAPMTGETLELAPGAKTPCLLTVLPGGTIAGRVLDPTGQAVAGAKVSASQGGGMFGRGGPTRETLSDAEGRFTLVGLGAGSYRPTSELDDWRNGRAEEPVEITGTETQSNVIVRMDPGRQVIGRVLMPNGSPAPGALVKLSQAAPKSADGDGGGMGWGRRGARPERKNTTADAQGEFRFTALATTAARLSAGLEAAEGGTAALAVALEDVQPAEAGKARPVDLRLAPTVSIRGRVVDDQGRPVKDFSVRAAREGFSSRDGAGDGVRETFADKVDGSFEMSGATPGPWQVSITAEGHESPEDQTLAVALPQKGAPLQFSLTRLGTVRGLVVDPNGTPVAGARVRRETTGFGGMRRQRGVETKADGTFEILNLTAGSQVLIASSEQWAASEATPFEVRPGTDTVSAILTLRRGGTIRGVVRDDTGRPWAGRRVSYATGGGPMGMFGGEGTSETDVNGEFVFERVAPGSWVVNASPGEREMMETMQSGDRQAAFFELMAKNLTADVDVVDGEEVTVELGALARDPVVAFGNVTHNGDMVREGTVTFALEGADLFANLKRGEIGKDGAYRIELDRPGAYVVSVERNSKRNQFLSDVASGAEQRIDLALPEGGVAGRVRNSEGEAAVGVRVTVEPRNALSFARFDPRSATTDENGDYEILELDPGTYTVRFGSRTFGRGGGGGSQNGNFGRAVIDGVAVNSSAVTAGVDVNLTGAGRITGVVLDSAGDPVSGATIFVRDRSGRPVDSISTTRTGSSGKFTYSRLSPGTYSVSARSGTAAAPDVSGVVVDEGKDSDVELTVETGSTLVITTVDDEGEAVRAQLSVTDSDGREMSGLLGAEFFRSFRTGISTTEQKVGPLTPGRYTVLATAQDGRTAKKRVTVRTKAETRVRVKFKD